jgi:hypothetical protein
MFDHQCFIYRFFVQLMDKNFLFKCQIIVSIIKCKINFKNPLIFSITLNLLNSKFYLKYLNQFII